MNDLQFGMSIWPQYTHWDDMQRIAQLADELGYDHIWTWDHFMPIIGDPDGPNYESWPILSAWGALTRNVHIGALVCGITYRNPAVLAKLASTLDHITHGRAILGIGAGWFEREHQQYGIEFGTVGQRLAKLAEAAPILRSLLDEPVTSYDGQYYKLTEARSEPKPVQKHLPIMIGGGGERKTLRITAQYADMWNGLGTVELAAHKIDVLKQHCADVGRDINEITTTMMIPIIIRDRASDIDEVKQSVLSLNRMDHPPQAPGLFGDVETVAQGVAAYARVGINGIILRTPPPYDRETIERLIGEVRPRVREILHQSPVAIPQD